MPPLELEWRLDFCMAHGFRHLAQHLVHLMAQAQTLQAVRQCAGLGDHIRRLHLAADRRRLLVLPATAEARMQRHWREACQLVHSLGCQLLAQALAHGPSAAASVRRRPVQSLTASASPPTCSASAAPGRVSSAAQNGLGVVCRGPACYLDGHARYDTHPNPRQFATPACITVSFRS